MALSHPPGPGNPNRLAAVLIPVFFLLFLTAPPRPAEAQASAHQRTGVGILSACDINLAAGMNVSPIQNSSGSILALDASLSADFLFSGKYSLSVMLPWVVQVAAGRNARFPVLGAPGDPEFTVGLSLRRADWRFGLDAFYSHPAGISDIAHSEALGFQSGTGQRSYGLGLRANRFLDPLSLGFSLLLSRGSPHSDIHGISQEPFSIKAGFSVTEALNRSTALSLTLTQSLAAPTLRNGIPDPGGFRHSANLSGSVSLTSGGFALRIGASGSIVDRTIPVSVFITGSRSFHIGRKE